MKRKTQKTALVVEGGGMRSVFSAGVLHAFGEKGFDPFDLYIGVSAGACNLASHLAGQNDRNWDIIATYSSTPNFISAKKFLRGGHYMDLDWLWDVTMREYRLDLSRLFTKLKREKKEYIVVATSAETGHALYLKPDAGTLEHFLKVSSSLPILYRNMLETGSEKATDGGIADSIPVIEARRRGAADITVIRSRPADYVKKGSSLTPLFSLIFREHTRLVGALKNRHVTYMEAVRFIQNPPKGVRVREIAPPPNTGVGRTTRDMDLLRALYQIGIVHGYEFIARYKAKSS
jgi:predicted patatin/cPLA2 family phospholipase